MAQTNLCVETGFLDVDRPEASTQRVRLRYRFLNSKGETVTGLEVRSSCQSADCIELSSKIPSSDGGTCRVKHERTRWVTNDRAHVYAIVDASGSMKSALDDIEDAVVAFEAARRPNDDVYIALFDEKTVGLCMHDNCNSPKLRAKFGNQASGMMGATALWEAIYRAAGLLGTWASKTRAEADPEQPPAPAILFVFTDGGENWSNTLLYNVATITALLRQQQLMVRIYEVGNIDRAQLLALTRDEAGGYIQSLSGSFDGGALGADMMQVAHESFESKITISDCDSGIPDTIGGGRALPGLPLENPCTLEAIAASGQPYTVATFDFDEYTLDRRELTAVTQRIARIQALMAKYPTASITVTGYTDEPGDTQYNADLSWRRANLIWSRLVKGAKPVRNAGKPIGAGVYPGSTNRNREHRTVEVQFHDMPKFSSDPMCY